MFRKGVQGVTLPIRTKSQPLPFFQNLKRMFRKGVQGVTAEVETLEGLEIREEVESSSSQEENQS